MKKTISPSKPRHHPRRRTGLPPDAQRQVDDLERMARRQLRTLERIAAATEKAAKC